MDMQYRNTTGQTVTFELGGHQYMVSSGSTVLIPEKYDYAIEMMCVCLEKDYELTFAIDQEQNPENWISSTSEVEHTVIPEPIIVKKKKPGPKKK